MLGVGGVPLYRAEVSGPVAFVAAEERAALLLLLLLLLLVSIVVKRVIGLGMLVRWSVGSPGS